MRSTFIIILTFCFSFMIKAQEVQLNNARNSCNDYLKLKKEMDAVSQKIFDDYERDFAFISKFKKAQSAWEAHRDAQLEMIFSSDNKSVYGTNYATCRCNNLVEMTNERLSYLVRWISMTEEGKSCGGSINSTKRKSYVRFSE